MRLLRFFVENQAKKNKMHGMNEPPIDKSTEYTAVDVAKAFLERAQRKDLDKDDEMTNMKLNKLVYFAQVMSVRALAKTIHKNSTHAWDYGPVAPLLYKRIKKFRANSISLDNEEVREVFSDAKEISEPEFVLVIDEVWAKLKGLSAVELSAMTHRRNTPWRVVYDNEKTRYGIISPELMRKYGYGDAPQ